MEIASQANNRKLIDFFLFVTTTPNTVCLDIYLEAVCWHRLSKKTHIIGCFECRFTKSLFFEVKLFSWCRDFLPSCHRRLVIHYAYGLVGPQEMRVMSIFMVHATHGFEMETETRIKIKVHFCQSS